jgi:hypothetical protein
MYNLQDVLICTTKEQCSDNETIHEEDTTTVKTLYLIFYDNVNGSIILVLVMVPNRHFGAGSGSKRNRCQIGGPGCQ